jgi:acetoin utilization deacetylase AcuC-like enzyme
MGFCYLNQVAIAALHHAAAGRRVAVWDFDAHHGNGTEDILQGRPNLLFASVHQYPGYPGTGTASAGNCHNFPVAPRTPRTAHMAELARSWEAVLAFKPDLVLVSAGFDAYARDPITAMTLEREDFAELGRWLRQGGLPAAAVLEGGYSSDLPELIDAFLSAWEN